MVTYPVKEFGRKECSLRLIFDVRCCAHEFEVDRIKALDDKVSNPLFLHALSLA